jgi:hypothetical protein
MATWPDRHGIGAASPLVLGRLGLELEGKTMWNFADRVVKAMSDMTVGTVIVLVHVAMADRKRVRSKRLAS